MDTMWAAVISFLAALVSFFCTARHYALSEQAGRLNECQTGRLIDRGLLIIMILALALFLGLATL